MGGRRPRAARRMLTAGHFSTGEGIPSNPSVFPSRWETSPSSLRRGLKSIITVVSEVFGRENDQISSGDMPRICVSQAHIPTPVVPTDASCLSQKAEIRVHTYECGVGKVQGGK